jgi:hypothetical protein
MRSAATHTRQHKAAIAILRRSTLLTALETAPTMTASYVARMTHTRFFTFSKAQCAPPRTCRIAPRSPLPSHHKHTRADTRDETSPTQHNGTAASWRVSPNTTHAHNPRNAHRTPTCRIQTHKPRTPARRPAHPQPLRTAQSSPHAHRCAHATHSTAHSPDHPTRRPQKKITPSHTRGLHATLTIVESGCPASTGCCRRVCCRTSSTVCRTHEQPSRHTMAPDAAPDPSQSPATHRSASHVTNQIRSNEGQSVHCMLSLTHNTVCE